MDTRELARGSWSALEAYFRDTPHFLTTHHLDSYEDFAFSRIPNTIRSLNPFRVVKTDPNDTQHVVLDVKVWVGGEDGSRVYLDRPVLADGGGAAGKPRLLFPNEARLRDLSYLSHLSADVEVHYDVWRQERGEYEKVVRTLERVELGAIPVMLHSRLCALHGLSADELRELGECPYDQGGYFVIDGKEKVIIAQERGATNRLYVNAVPASPTARREHTHMAYIRCTSEEDALFPKTMQLFVLSGEIARGTRRGAIVATVPHISAPVPLFVLFRALGVESDRDILEHVVGDVSAPDAQPAIELLKSSINDCPGVYNQAQALEYLRHHVEYRSVEHARYVLLFNCLPNAGHEFRCKALFLGHIVNRLVRTSIGLHPETDRDNYALKRVTLSGFMLADIFRDFYNTLRRHVRSRIDREYELGPWKDSGNVTELVNGANRGQIFRPDFITEGMHKSMKGNWALMEDPAKAGIVQDLSRVSYLGAVSHLRRVNTPIDRSIKIVSPHRLNASQWGVMCPVESPDGASIGLIKNIALLARVTFDVPSQPALDALRALEAGTGSTGAYVRWLQHIAPADIREHPGAVRVFVNSCWVAITEHPAELVMYMRLLRRNALISPFMSVSWSVTGREVQVLTEPGRCCRPLLVVDQLAGGLLARTRGTLKRLAAGTLGWRDLVRGGRMLSEQFDYYRRDFTDPWGQTGTTSLTELLAELRETQAVVEYVDVEEANCCYIAMSPDELDEARHTHMELHPSTIFSAYTATIPLSNHNQAPRNIFSGAQGKQAVGVYATSFNSRIDTMAYVLHYPQRPLLTTRYMDLIGANALPFGENLIVAVASYTGYNQEDSIIMNRASIERGCFNMTYFKAVVEDEVPERGGSGTRIIFAHPLTMKTQPGAGAVKPRGFANYSKLDPDTGLPRRDAWLEEGDVVFGRVAVSTEQVKERADGAVLDDLVLRESYEDRSVRADKTITGFVDRVVVTRSPRHGARRAKVRLRKVRMPELGDKCASRHGQKGVIGMILSPEDMPFTANGLVPDLIVNPHAFPTRMTIGHMIEAVIGKACCKAGCTYDGTPFEPHNIDAIYDMLEDAGMQRHGEEVMYSGITGEQMATSVFVGPTYYMRLKHMVADKLNYRVTGPVTSITHQPTKGRSNEGGLRIGNMETDVLVSHGLAAFLKESMIERSDGTRFGIDAALGVPTAYLAGACSKDETLPPTRRAVLAAPHALQVLLAELGALGLDARMLVGEEGAAVVAAMKDDTVEDVQLAVEEYLNDEASSAHADADAF